MATDRQDAHTTRLQKDRDGSPPHPAVPESQLRLQSAALEAAANGIVITDRAGRIIWVNPAFTALTGYPAAEVLGQNPRILKSGHHSDTFYGELWETILAGRVWHGEMVNRRKDGTFYTEAMTITPVRDGGGEISHYIAIKEDVTEQRRAEQALQESNQRLAETLTELQLTQRQVIQQERLHALGQIASGIAHDFNNALAPMLGFTELLLMRPEVLEDREKTTRYLQMVHTAAKDAAHVVSRLREFYRARDESDVRFPVNLNQTIAQAVSLTQPRWKDQAQAAGVTIEVETDLQKLPYVAGNEGDLREVLTNLILNAVDAILPQKRDGKITLRTATEGNRVLLAVSDTGSGMTAEVRQRCLEPFFSTKGAHGTGLGLSMVYGIVKRHGGAIEIASEVNRGTTIQIRLPVQEAERLPSSEPVARPAARWLRILLVDDEPLVRDIETEFLRGDGHTVEAVGTGAEALEKLQAGSFDLVVTDRAMPGVNGDQLAGAVKQIAPEMPVILLTGFGVMMEAAGEKPPGVDFVLSKPVSLTELRQAISRVAERAAAR